MVVMAPPRLWPIRIVGGRAGQDCEAEVRVIMDRASAVRAERL